ncbi:hypothetical protein [Geobacillus thermoleovorans]|uniref:hypothetical protein n=1 Tax=Geobacillus thermoleovorans TaxID=33941 RepID=UPI003D1EB733
MGKTVLNRIFSSGEALKHRLFFPGELHRFGKNDRFSPGGENIPIENAHRHGIINNATASYPSLTLFRSFFATAGTIRIRQG